MTDTRYSKKEQNTMIYICRTRLSIGTIYSKYILSITIIVKKLSEMERSQVYVYYI